MQQRSDAKRSTCSEFSEKNIKGKIDGYFGLARVGRPPKAKFVAATTCAEKPCYTQDEIKDSSSQRNKQKQVIKNWSTSESFHYLKAAVLENLVSGEKAIVYSEVPVLKISRHLQTFRDIPANGNTSMVEITSNVIFKQRVGGIISRKDIEFLQDMSVAIDEANNGMTCLEIVNFIKELTGVNEHKKAEN